MTTYPPTAKLLSFHRHMTSMMAIHLRTSVFNRIAGILAGAKIRMRLFSGNTSSATSPDATTVAPPSTEYAVAMKYRLGRRGPDEDCDARGGVRSETTIKLANKARMQLMKQVRCHSAWIVTRGQLQLTFGIGKMRLACGVSFGSR